MINKRNKSENKNEECQNASRANARPLRICAPTWFLICSCGRLALSRKFCVPLTNRNLVERDTNLCHTGGTQLTLFMGPKYSLFCRRYCLQMSDVSKSPYQYAPILSPRKNRNSFEPFVLLIESASTSKIPYCLFLATNTYLLINVNGSCFSFAFPY